MGARATAQMACPTAAESGAAAAPVPSPEPAAPHENPPARLPRRERLVVWGGIAAVTAVAWLALVRMPMPATAIHGAGMGGMAAGMDAGRMAWSLRDAWLIFAMWTVMMTAMMLPSTSPMIEMYARIARGGTIGRVSLLVGGYLIAWAGFALLATAAQYFLQHARVLVDPIRLRPSAGALLLIATGVYQFTSLKQACLTQCRSPLGFFMTRWRPGVRGALAMGFDHGAFCVGCCWLLMSLMFVAGMMNLAWAVALTIFVLLEKAAPSGAAFSRLAGAAMVAAGLALAVCA